MNAPCSAHEDLARWAQDGAGAPLGEALDQHVTSCAACRREHAAIVDVRRRLQALPVRRIPPERLDAMRFALIAAARASTEAAQQRPTSHADERPDPPPARRPSPRRYAVLIAMAGILVLAPVLARVGGGRGAADPPSNPPPSTTTAPTELAARSLGAPAAPSQVDGESARAIPSAEPANDSPVHTPEAASSVANARATARATAPTKPSLRARAGATRRGPAADEAAFDAAFQRALDLLRKGQAAEAAASFDALRDSAAADPGRRADALYWAAKAHAKAGRAATAEDDARKVIETHPDSWHADDAALLLGESLMQRGDAAGARPWLERAARSPRESIRARAARALDALAHGVTATSSSRSPEGTSTVSTSPTPGQ